MTPLPDTTRAPISPPAPSGTVLQDAFGPLLCLDRRDRAGLKWIKTRCRTWLTALKRRRRYAVPRGCGYTSEEAEAIEALTTLETATTRLLATIRQSEFLCEKTDDTT